MDNHDIYESAKAKAFNKIKNIRNAHAVQPEEVNPIARAALDSRVLDIGGKDYGQYSFIVEEATSYSYDMFCEIFVALLKRYKTDFELVDFAKYGLYPKPILAFIQKTSNGDNLFIIREYGLNHRINDKLMAKFAIAKQVRYAYVSLVEQNAFSEILNHNNDENDPARGTHTLSLPFFLRFMFGEEEENTFMTFISHFTKEVKSFLGMSVTRTLTPNAQFSFRRSADYELLHFNYKGKYQKLIGSVKCKEALDEIKEDEKAKKAKNPRFVGKSDAPISEEQWRALNNQFIEKSYYKVLLGRRDCAQSFLTAEWLYDSMAEAGRIDYSPVAMGYFKSVEQLIWDILFSHKGDSISIKRKGAPSYLPINSSEIKWEDDDPGILDTTIGALIGALDFFKHRPMIFKRNIDDKTCDAIIILLHMFKNLRNGYTHKDNITDWEFITLVRDTAYVTCCLLLGSCAIDSKDFDRLGIPDEGKQTSYFELCDYINYHCGQPYYLYDAAGTCKVAIGTPDEGITFDEYGLPTYSGAYFQDFPRASVEAFVISLEEIDRAIQSHHKIMGDVFRLDEDNMPMKIYSGVRYPVAEGMRYSGPQQLIYDNGVFLDPGMTEKPEY